VGPPGTVSVLDIKARKVLGDYSRLRQYAADCDIAGRPLGVYLDQPSRRWR